MGEQLDQQAGFADHRDHPRPGGGGPPIVVPPGTWAQLRSADGSVLSSVQLADNSAQPKLPARLPTLSPAAGGEGLRLFTVASTTGSGSFRVLEAAKDNGQTTLIAIPTTEVSKALHQLVLIEAAAVAGLLLLLSAGSWIVFRRGLRPLERMAATAGTISAGDLSQRVSPAGGPTEIGQLGLALNVMLGDIEAAFAEREATEQRLRQFLADASHELRTPLTSIQGFAELFRVSGEQGRVDLPTILRRIEEESARMSVLVEDLLLLARLDQPRAAARVAVDLAVVAAEACRDAVATAPDRAIRLDAPAPVIVAGDPLHLRQAVANLMTNAVRHTPAGTAIEVGARLTDGTAVISVRDHGHGLDDESLAHAFNRFWQADKARVGAGVGLGLAIVAAIAAEHGGSAMAANANADGGGAVFTLILPVDPAAVGDAP